MFETEQKNTAGDIAKVLRDAIDCGGEEVRSQVFMPLFDSTLDAENGTFWFTDRNGKRWLATVTPLD